MRDTMLTPEEHDWYWKAREKLLTQQRLIHDDMKMPNRYQEYREVVNELERLERWRRACIRPV